MTFDLCFGWKRLCFGRLTFNNRGHYGSRYRQMIHTDFYIGVPTLEKNTMKAGRKKRLFFLVCESNIYIYIQNNNWLFLGPSQVQKFQMDSAGQSKRSQYKETTAIITCRMCVHICLYTQHESVILKNSHMGTGDQLSYVQILQMDVVPSTSQSILPSKPSLKGAMPFFLVLKMHASRTFIEMKLSRLSTHLKQKLFLPYNLHQTTSPSCHHKARCFPMASRKGKEGTTFELSLRWACFCLFQVTRLCLEMAICYQISWL